MKESRQGLVYARMKGVSAAQGAYICFIDDDNLPTSAYFEQVLLAFENYADVGVFGCGTQLPASLRVSERLEPFLSSYAVGSLHGRHGVLDRGETVWGAGVACRSTAIKRLYSAGFVPLLVGRAGNKQLAGDDSELVLALTTCGWKVWHDPRPLITHALNPGRLNSDSLVKLHQGFGASGCALAAYRHQLNRRRFFESGLSWLFPMMFSAKCTVLLCTRLLFSFVGGVGEEMRLRHLTRIAYLESAIRATFWILRQWPTLTRNVRITRSISISRD